MSERDVRPLGDAREQEALAAILSLAFGAGEEEARGWVEKNDPGTGRVLVEDGAVVGGLFVHPMGQWFGGRSVPMVGIGGVGMDPGARATGGATHLMRETVRALHADGVPISTLFPATQPLYRRAGYEQAGSHFRVTVQTDRLRTHERGLAVRRAAVGDLPAIDRLHVESGRENDGNVERSPMMWGRVRDPIGSRVHAFVIEGPDGLEGYVYYVSKPNARGHQDLTLSDVVVRTPAAARRLLTFLLDHRSLVDSVSWRGHPADPLLLQAREQRHDVRLWDTWMLRIVDVEQALTLRGYPPNVEAEVHLDVADDLLPANHGRFVLHVANGTASVVRGGAGRVRLDVRDLAPLYTGFATAAQLRTARGIRCADEETGRLTAVFGGSAPWIQAGF